jgi:hypothetical protein
MPSNLTYLYLLLLHILLIPAMKKMNFKTLFSTHFSRTNSDTVPSIAKAGTIVFLGKFYYSKGKFHEIRMVYGGIVGKHH